MGSSQTRTAEPDPAPSLSQGRGLAPVAVRSDFRPRRWFRGGHLQTLAAFFLSRRIDLPPAEKRMIEVEPGISVLCHCHWQKERSRALTLIIVHGLEGSSESQYMLGIARNGLAAGMNVVRMNQRNCGGMDHCAPTLYNSGRSPDVAAVARNIVEQDEIPGFVLIGFSMGGNLVLKLAGEWGNNGPPQFRGVAAVCPAINLAAGADALHEPANRIYEYYFLLQLFRRFRRKVKLFPAAFDASRLRGVRTLRDFDDRVTAYYCDYAGADDYYDRAAGSHVIDRIAVPYPRYSRCQRSFRSHPARNSPETARQLQYQFCRKRGRWALRVR